jgi:hypothetical protein
MLHVASKLPCVADGVKGRGRAQPCPAMLIFAHRLHLIATPCEAGETSVSLYRIGNVAAVVPQPAMPSR